MYNLVILSHRFVFPNDVKDTCQQFLGSVTKPALNSFLENSFPQKTERKSELKRGRAFEFCGSFPINDNSIFALGF